VSAVVLKSAPTPIEKLRRAEWNPNRVAGPTLEKLRRSIADFGFVENLVARPYPGEPDALEVLSGNHRLELLRELGVKSVPVVVIDVDDAHARLLAQTLNRTRGRDDPLAYQELLETIASVLPHDEIVAVIPETHRSLQDVLGELEVENVDIPETWAIIVLAKDLGEQQDLLDRFHAEGREARELVGQ
jgi:ParB-like chromosome segregation protein Spo0J